MRVVVVGATGAVGSEMMSILEERRFPLDELVPVASARSAGRKLSFRGDSLQVRELSHNVFAGADLALFDVPDEISRAWAPIAAEHGCVAIDNSGAWRMDPQVPLIVPEINPGALARIPRGIVASPNCTTLAMVVPLFCLHRLVPLKRLVLASYQAVSGAGKAGVDELWDQTELAAKEPDLTRAGLAREFLRRGEVFDQPISFNAIPRCGSLDDEGYTSEERKLCRETCKILSLPELPITATCVRVPVVRGHGVAVHAEFERPIGVEEAKHALSGAPGVELVDDLEGPTPLDAAGRDACYVGRVRQDPFDPRALAFFSVADNLRKGAALNTVQIAEALLSPAPGG